MPLRFLDGFTDPQAVKEATEQYLIFYSSIVDGKLWCPDCRDVESLINQTFSAAAGPSALIVYVGNRSEWKTPSNPFRGGDWKITGVPTVIRVKDGAEGARLVESEIASGLSTLVKA